MINKTLENYIRCKVLKELSDNPKNFKEKMAFFRRFWFNECKDKEDLRKCLNKINNEDISGYEKVKSWSILQFFTSFIMGEKGFFTEYFDSINKINIDNLSLNEVESIVLSNDLVTFTNFFNHGIVFDIPEYLQKLFLETEVKLIFNDKLFYNHLFLDLKNLKVSKDIVLFGIFLKIGNILNDSEGNKIPSNNSLGITAIGKDLRDNEPVWITGYVNGEGVVGGYSSNKFSFMNESEHEVFFEKICLVVLNFIKFLNHPEVELVLHDKSLIRKNKMRKGKLGIPDNIEINITGRLKKYLDEIIESNTSNESLGYRFWVRGHWVNFRSERYKNVRGTSVWILPYIKGSGELINKKYFLGNREDWYHQKRMKEILMDIYSDKKIKKCRILNGLEIDCFIPELSLGFEYNGEQHYIFPNSFHKNEEEFRKQQERDILKNKVAKEKQIRLITIRYDEILSKELILSKIKGL